MGDYFACIGLKCTNHQQQGEDMFERLSNGTNILDKSRPQVYSQPDYSHGIGYYPQISLLDELHEVAPDSTFVFQFRPIADWIRSTGHWYNMLQRFGLFEMPGLVLTPEQRTKRTQLMADYPILGRTPKQSGIRNDKKSEPEHDNGLTGLQQAKWWCGHVLHIREYVSEYPSHALIELDLYDSNGTASYLYDLFQADTDAHHYASKHETADEGATPTTTLTQCWGESNKSSEHGKRAKAAKNKTNQKEPKRND